MALIRLNNQSISSVTALPSGIDTGKVLQVVTATHNSDINTSSTSFVDAGLSASITPSSTSNKVYILLNFCLQNAGSNQGNNSSAGLSRGTTHILEKRVQSYDQGGSGVEYEGNTTIAHLDSPSTTSSTTYKLQYKLNNGSQARLQHSGTKIASLTLMEIAG